MSKTHPKFTTHQTLNKVKIHKTTKKLNRKIFFIQTTSRNLK